MPNIKSLLGLTVGKHLAVLNYSTRFNRIYPWKGYTIFGKTRRRKVRLIVQTTWNKGLKYNLFGGEPNHNNIKYIISGIYQWHETLR